MQKIVFAGTPEIAQICLQALITAGYDILACLTQPDRPKGRGREVTASPVKQLALQHKIPVYQPEKLLALSTALPSKQLSADLSGSVQLVSGQKQQLLLHQAEHDKQDVDVVKILQELAPDIIVVVAYGMLIPQAVLAIPKYGCVNVHTSLLPRWRGAAPIQRAIEAGDTETGVTIMQMDVGLDTGGIWEQYACAITSTMTAGELYQQLAKLGAAGLLQTLPKIWNNSISLQPQQQELATYARKISKQDGAIKWEQAARDICLQVRAFNPWPVAYATLNSLQIRIWRAEELVCGEDGDTSKTDYFSGKKQASKSPVARTKCVLGASESSQHLSKNIGEGQTTKVLPGTIVSATATGIAVMTGDGVLLLREIQLPGKKAMAVNEVLKSQHTLFNPGAKFKDTICWDH